METTVDKITINRKALDGRERPSGHLRKWLTLLIGVFLVWVFMFVVAPLIQESPSVKPITEFIENSGIDAGALYYTDLDETSEAEMFIRTSLEQ